MKQSLFILVSTIILLAFSCEKDDNPIIAAGNFLGTYDVTENCDGSNVTYDVLISAVGTDGKAIQIYNLWEWSEAVFATVNGNNITIPTQIIDGITFVGSGTLSGKTLTINYTAAVGANIESCIAVCEKR